MNFIPVYLINHATCWEDVQKKQCVFVISGDGNLVKNYSLRQKANGDQIQRGHFTSVYKCIFQFYTQATFLFLQVSLKYYCRYPQEYVTPTSSHTIKAGNRWKQTQCIRGKKNRYHEDTNLCSLRNPESNRTLWPLSHNTFCDSWQA